MFALNDKLHIENNEEESNIRDNTRQSDGPSIDHENIKKRR
jgi:hypothetical protein